MVRLLSSNRSLASVGMSLLRAIRHNVVPLRARGGARGEAPLKLPLVLTKGVACSDAEDTPLDSRCPGVAMGSPVSDVSDALDTG